MTDDYIFSEDEDKELFKIVKNLIILSKDDFDPSNPEKNKQSREKDILSQLDSIKE
jgi:hypothetical protein